MKIYIIGSVGSGKSTLGKILALKMQIPHIQTDNLVWARHPEGDIRNTDERRNQLLAEAISCEGWLVEGVHIGWTDSVIKEADHIIFLDPPYLLRSFRILKRHVKQLLGIEKANYKANMDMLGKMHRWNAYFEQKMKPEFIKKLEEQTGKVKYVQNRKEFKSLLINMESKSYNK